MKLTARKTLVALGTTAAVSLSGLTAPAMAADATAKSATTATAGATATDKDAQKQTCAADQSDALYSQKYHQVMDDKAAAKKLLDQLNTSKAGIDASQLDNDGKSALAEAEQALGNAQFRLDRVDLPSSPCGKSTSAEYGELKNAADQIAEAERDLTTASSKLRQAQPVVCDGKQDDQKKDDDSSSGSSFLDFGSLVQSFGSSGEMQVTKDGKKKCVSRVDYYSDKLKSIVSILTVLFTVITTVTKINETIQKQVMPK